MHATGNGKCRQQRCEYAQCSVAGHGIGKVALQEPDAGQMQQVDLVGDVAAPQADALGQEALQAQKEQQQAGCQAAPK